MDNTETGIQRTQRVQQIPEQIINELEAAYPGFRARLVNEEEDRLRPDVAVAVDGEISNEGMRRKVGESSEVNFLPAMSGG